ncbi:general stress protein [Pseudarthrobacter sp. B907]|uniref:general stress protein n=1 Tax=Pseudarthrobacter sp. B907 TaxID=3158261 RepID=UPI0032DB6E04
MSNIFGGPKAGAPGGADESRAVPKGDTVGSYNSYLDAQKAVDYLADQQFPVQLVSIVGNDLKMVERVTGRLTYPRVALSGALSGMWFGLFVGVMLSFFSETGGYFSIVTSVLMGAAFFMLFGIVTYAMQRGKRDFTSTSQVVATNYDVVVAFEAAHEARRLLHQLPMTQHDAAAPGYQQFDHQHQPYQQGPQQQPGPQQPGQPGQGPGPQRPAGWSDPYGQRASDAAPQQRAAGEPVAQEPEPARPAGVTYPDLPDGRPQYGVRVTDQPRQGERTPDEPRREGEQPPER